jgi:alpha-tubulin suppressor-like RCC1 family protein
VKIACGAYHNLALLEDGGVSAWVSQIATAKPDYFGSASSGRTHQQSSLPTGFMAGRTAAAVAAGAYHNLVLFSDGTVGAWGKNDAGQATVPAGLSNVVRIIAFGDTSIAIKADGQIVSWGRVSNTVPMLDRPALTPVTPMTLEQSIAYIGDDELVEVTPQSIRIRKRFLTENERKRATKSSEAPLLA